MWDHNWIRLTHLIKDLQQIAKLEYLYVQMTSIVRFIFSSLDMNDLYIVHASSILTR